MQQPAEFIAHCAKEYTKRRELSEAETAELFNRYAVPDYLLKCYETLCREDIQYVIDDIGIYIKVKQLSGV